MRRRRYIIWMRVVRFAAKRAAKTGHDVLPPCSSLTFDYTSGRVYPTPQTATAARGFVPVPQTQSTQMGPSGSNWRGK